MAGFPHLLASSRKHQSIFDGQCSSCPPNQSVTVGLGPNIYLLLSHQILYGHRVYVVSLSCLLQRNSLPDPDFELSLFDFKCYVN